ncbi:MAG: glycine cleavage system protein R [Acidimicrobiales bacterium]
MNAQQNAGAHAVVTVFGADRPGIVAGVTEALTALGCNLEDTSMTILRGCFAMILVVDPGPEVSRADPVVVLSQALEPVAGAMELTVTVRPMAPVDPARSSGRGPEWTVAVYGADRVGIVSRVTRLLADHRANIVDLSTRVVDSGSDPAYLMVIEIVLGPEADAVVLEAGLAELASALGVSASLHPGEADIL